ncbi:MAG: aminotransferase class I/II-fold pyridoxal phosphate-dependent enzyme [Bacillota bacterium]
MKINRFIKEYVSKDYGGSTPSGCVLDCSLGVNPAPLPGFVLERLSTISGEIIKNYPHDEALLHKLIRRFSGVARLAPENLLLGNGSYDILCNLNLLCLGRDKTVLGHAPQFPAYVDHVHCIGANSRFYAMQAQDNYRFDADGYIALMDEHCDMSIVENPNNPTGQVITIADMERIAKRALQLDTVLVVDEAYGDYMLLANSAIRLIENYPNVVVTRSFSKGFGLAGIRLGYAVSSPELIAQFRKLQLSFNCNGVARELACALLESGVDVPRAEQTAQTKVRVLACLHKFRAAHTCPVTPILTIYCEDEATDLQALLARAGLGAVGCAGYEGLSKNAARLMMCGDAELLVSLLEKAQGMLG